VQRFRSEAPSRGWAACRTVLLETRRRNGEWVGTPVSLVVEDGRAYFRTYDAAGKAKRLRNHPDVRVAPCTLRGRPTGPSVGASTRLLHGQESEHARALLAAAFPVLHGRLVPWLHRRKGWTTLHYELDLAGSA
jgi:PPOX class probable F420-dependent enzyme